MIDEEKFLRIAPSSIPNIGKGLFTLKVIKEGELICKFGGRLMNKVESAEILREIENGGENSEETNYYISLSSGLILDTYESDFFGRYANDAEGIMKNHVFKNNALIVEGEDGVSAYLEAITDIPAGSEIFTSYGDAYWESFLEEESTITKMF